MRTTFFFFFVFFPQKKRNIFFTYIQRKCILWHTFFDIDEKIEKQMQSRKKTEFSDLRVIVLDYMIFHRIYVQQVIYCVNQSLIGFLLFTFFFFFLLFVCVYVYSTSHYISHIRFSFHSVWYWFPNSSSTDFHSIFSLRSILFGFRSFSIFIHIF